MRRGDERPLAITHSDESLQASKALLTLEVSFVAHVQCKAFFNCGLRYADDHQLSNQLKDVMPTLTIHLSEFEASLLDDLVTQTGKTQTEVLLAGLHALANDMREDDRVTRLSNQAFEAFLNRLEEGENDPQVLAARKLLMGLKPVWEK